MGLPLTMTPDYETGECQFAFGVSPTEEEERDAMNTPCLSRCPSGGGLRSLHLGKDQWIEDLNNLAQRKTGASCFLMSDTKENESMLTNI